MYFGADTKKDRTQDSIKLLEYAFANYTYVDLAAIANEEFSHFRSNYLNNVIINKSTESTLESQLEPISTPLIPMHKDLVSSITSTVSFTNYFEAPVLSGEYLGSVYIHQDDELLLSIPFNFTSDIQKKNTFDYFFQLISSIGVF